MSKVDFELMYYTIDYKQHKHTTLGSYHIPSFKKDVSITENIETLNNTLTDIIAKTDSVLCDNVTSTEWPCVGIMFKYDNFNASHFVEYKCFLSLIKPPKSPKTNLITSTIDTLTLSCFLLGINGAEIIIAPAKKNDTLLISYRIYCHEKTNIQLIANIFPDVCSNFRIGIMKGQREEFTSVKKNQLTKWR